MGRKKLNSVDNTTEQNVEKKFIVYKRCGKASNIIMLPHTEKELQYTSFTEGKGLKLEQGDIVNTSRQNQLLVVFVVKINPTVLLDIKESGFDPQTIIAHNVLDDVDLVRIKEKEFEGNKVFIINKRIYKYVDIKDAARLLYLPESIINSIQYDSEEKCAIVPSVVYSVLGSLQANLFPKLYEE